MDRGPDKEAYRWFFTHENNVERDDWDAIIALSRAFSKSGPALDAAVAPLIDANEWARTFALQTLMGIGDSYTRGNNHNIFLYQRPSDGRLLVLPWDWDFAFFQPTNSPLFGDQRVSVLLQRPGMQRLYYANLQELMATVFHPGYQGRWVDHYDDFTPGQSFASILNYVTERRAFVLSQLPTPAQLTITNAPATGTLTSASSLTLNGTAPWGAATVRLTGPGGTVDAGFSTIDQWSANLPLLLGTNAITLTAYDLKGAVIGTQTFTVVSTDTMGFVDLDGDGLPDAWEKANGLEALPNATAAARDSDGDGQTNAAEYLAGTLPNAPASVLTLLQTAPPGGGIQLRFRALAGRSYRVMTRSALASGPWQPLFTHAPESADRDIEVIEPASAGQGFYRLETP